MKPTSKPVPVPAGFKLGPGAVAIVSKPSSLAEAVAGALEHAETVTGVTFPEHVKVEAIEGAKAYEQQQPKPAKAKKAKTPKPATVPGPVLQAMGAIPANTPGVPLLGAKGAKFTVLVPADLAVKVTKTVTGMGGWQRVLLELQAAYLANDGSLAAGVAGTLTLTPYLLNRLITLAVKHGSGGYQAVIRHVVCLAVSQYPGALIGPIKTEGGE